MGQFHVSWRGFQPVWGVWLPPGWLQPERLLAQWRSGARVLWAGEGWLLVFSRAESLPVEQLRGLAVVACQQGWTSHPDRPPQPGEVCLTWHGRSWSAPLEQLKRADLSEFWDWRELSYLASPPPSLSVSLPSLVRSAPEPVRKILPAVPPPAPEQQQFVRRFEQPSGPKNPLLGLFDLLKSFFSSPENQRYINKMFELFEQQNWQEALRHAIPIGESGNTQLTQFLGQLKPRSSLDFTSPLQQGGSIGTGLSGLELLKSVYRHALERLLAAGRIEEAAYVQGELLNDAAGAADLLERHGKLLEAARLATLKGLAAPLQVRLWFMAGQTQTALTLARRYHVEAEALQMLTRKDPELAKQFRAAWATDLADAGCLSQAISVGWTVRQQLEDYELWLARALLGGGVGALDALSFGLQDPDFCQRLKLVERLRAEFADYDLMGQPRRRAILERMTGNWLETRDPDLRVWAAETARRVMRQANSPFPLGDHRTMEFLVKLSGDPWLRADRPSTMRETDIPLGLWSERVDQQGITPLYDALWLGDGRLLLALGQAGLVILSRSGKFSQRFPQPAYHLVAGERPLVIGQGHLSRFDSGAPRYWCQAGLEGWAENHDGYHWLIWCGQELFVIDLTSPQWKAACSRMLPARPREVKVSGHSATLDLGPRFQAVLVPQLELTRDWETPAGYWVPTPLGFESIQWRGESFYFRNLRLPLEGSQPSFRERAGYCLVETVCPEGRHLLTFPINNPSQQSSLFVRGSSRLVTRVQGAILLVCDDLGRVLVADLQKRTWLARFFI
ncbi:MAG: bpX6 domain-containing protein [Vulcanimicrobiota bacterium]